jgi:glycosyltransferase 2 family protein
VKRIVLRFVLGAAVSGLILAALLSLTSPRAIADLLARTRPAGVLHGLLLYALAYALRALRLRALGLRARWPTLFHIACVHQALNKVLPLRAGELSYPWLARRIVGQGFGEALIGLAYLRFLDLVGVAVLFAGTLALHRSLYLGDLRLGFLASLVLLFGALAALLWLLPLLRLAIGLASRLLGPRAVLRRALAAVERFPKLGLRAHVSLAALTLAAWLLVYGTFHVLLAAFGVPLDGARTVLGATAGVIASVLPVQGLGSFGTLEAGWALGMSLVGMEPRTAIATGIGIQVFTFLYAMLLGASGWLALRRARMNPLTTRSV